MAKLLGGTTVSGDLTASGNVYTATPISSDNSTKSATTAFVANAISGISATYATLASPSFTGTPTAPTPATSDNSTKLATTAFVKSAISNGITGNGTVTQIVQVTQAQYNALTPVATTLYIIVG